MFMLIKLRYSDDLLAVVQRVNGSVFRTIKILKHPPISRIRNEGVLYPWSNFEFRILYKHNKVDEVINRGMLEIL